VILGGWWLLMSEVPLYIVVFGVNMHEHRSYKGRAPGDIGTLLPINQRQLRTLYIQKDVLPYQSC